MGAKLPPPGSDRVLYLFDLSGYVFRAYHAIAPLTSSKGEPTAAVLGTVNMIEKVLRERRPVFVAVAMDSKKPTFRKELDPRYKATRPPPPPDLSQQMGRCEEIVRAYDIPVFQLDGFEADDLIATAVRHARVSGFTVVIVSADKDLMQLVDDEKEDVLLWDSMRDRVFGAAEVREKFGVKPSQVRDFLALTGDTSDNVPGVASVGPKTASDLLNKFGSLKNLYAHLEEVERKKLKEALLTHEAEARLSQELVTLKEDIPLAWDLGHLRYTGPNPVALRAIFEELEFHRLLAQLEARPTIARTSEMVLDRAKLESVLAQAHTTHRMALVLHSMPTSRGVHGIDAVGVGIAVEAGKGYYVPVGHRYLGAPPQIAWTALLELLVPLLGDGAITKVFCDLKSVWPLFRATPFNGPLFDVMIADLVIDPDSTATIETIAKRTLGLELATAPEEKGTAKRAKGARPLDADAEEVAQTTRRAAPQADACVSCVDGLLRELETHRALPLFRDIEMPLVRILARMEDDGVLVDPVVLRGLSEAADHLLRELETRAHTTLGRPFSLRSRDQLEEILFDELSLPVLKKTAKGGRSTDAEVLDELALEHPLPKILLEYREIDKLKGTYLDALPRSIHPDTGRIHTRFSQIGAATGRIASTDPNLQNIPIRTELGRKIRAAFVAPPNMSLVSADYSQIELRVLAHLSEDPELLSAFSTGEDIHAHTASLIFNVSKADVTQEMRRRAKTINFGVIYGMGEVALARQLDISRAEASAFIHAYFQRYEGVRRFMDTTIERARAGESVQTLLGRSRTLLNLRSPNRMLRTEAERIAKNTPIQGTAADILKLAMVRLGEKEIVPGAKMILTVHDELVFEVPDASVANACRRINDGMSHVLELKVPLDVSVHHGKNWYAAHG